MYIARNIYSLVFYLMVNSGYLTRMKIQDSITNTRRANLARWIKDHCEGQQAKFVELTGINQGELSSLLKDKSFGEKKARKLEQQAGMPPLYLDMAEGVNLLELPVGSIAINKNKLAMVPVVGKSMGGLPDRLFTDEGRAVDGFDEYAEVLSTDPNAFVARVDGNSMYPKYVQGDYALVEPGTDPELEDDVIVKLTTGEVMLKRLMSRRGGIHLASYNETTTYLYQKEQIVWMYYVAHPIPSRRIKTRIS
jgi:phage repressor protein C with HTH and peptisase S24 domain